MTRKPPENVLRLIAQATARIAARKRSHPQLIPESTLTNRIRRRKGKKQS